MSDLLHEAAVSRLVENFGSNPQEVGAEDGTEDDWGDLMHEAAAELGLGEMSDEEWDHFQKVAESCRATTMDAWFTHLEAISQ